MPPQPGILLKTERMTGVAQPKESQAWRIQYTTTFPDGQPAIAIATVLAPSKLPPGPRPVITWEHGTIGLLQSCMYSLTALPFDGIPALDLALAQGWVVVATDYAAAGANGPHPYLIGEGQMRAAMDAVRAARKMPELSLDDRTVVWGHSQGGHATLWTGILGQGYAADLKLLGAVAIAPVTDIARAVSTNAAAGDYGLATANVLGSYVAASYSHFYPDVKFDDIVRPGTAGIVRNLSTLCTHDPKTDPLITQLNGAFPLFDLVNGAFGRRLRENLPGRPIAMPLLVVQGREDNLIWPFFTDDYVASRCLSGQALEYWTFAAANHQTIVGPGPFAPEIIRWTSDRFASMPQAGGCSRKDFQ